MNLPQQETIKQYLSDGIQTVYAFNFLILKAADLQVYVTPVGQTPLPEADIKEYGVDYTITGIGNPNGGTITYLSDFSNGDVFTLVRGMEMSIDTEFAEAKNFSGQNLDTAFQRIMLCLQQVNTYALWRNLSYRVNTYLPLIEPNTQVPKLPNGYIWKGQEGGVIATLLEESPDVGTLRTDLAVQDPITNGAALVGYYDANAEHPTTVAQYLNYTKLVATAGGTANAIVATVGNANIPAYVDGMELWIRIATTNTDKPTLALNSLAAIQCWRNATFRSQPQDFIAGEWAHLMYFGGKWIHLNVNPTPSGAAMDFNGNTPPAGWLEEDAAAISRTTYDALFAAIGTLWGVGDGSTTFNKPGSQRRTRIGAGGSASPIISNTVGSVGGEEEVTLTKAQMPEHGHPTADGEGGNFIVDPVPGSGPIVLDDIGGTLTMRQPLTGTAGGGEAHPNIQPSRVVRSCIKI